MKHVATWCGVVVLVAAALSSGPSLAFTTDALEEAGVSFAGYVEVEVSYTDAEEGGADAEEGGTSDVALAELALGVEYSPTDWLSFSVTLIYEDGDDGVSVDQAIAGLGGTETMPVVFTVGRTYLPIGEYSSVYCPGLFCSDPLTQSLSEAQEDVLQASYDFGVGWAAVGVANGDVDEVGADDDIGLYYAVVELRPVEGLTVAVAYTSNLADSDELTDLVPEQGITDEVAGFAAYVIYENGPFYGQVGYVSALDSFAAGDLDGDEDGSGDEPEALNIEVGYEVLADLRIGVRYATSEEFAGFAQDQYGLTVNYALLEGALLSLEYLHSELADDSEADTVTGRFMLEF